MPRYNIITNRLNSIGDPYFVNSEFKFTNDIQKGCNTDTENESNEKLESLSNIEIEGRYYHLPALIV